MNFDLPKNLKSNSKTLNFVPKNLISYKIPFAKPKFVTFNGGSYLSQQLKGEGFNIWVHHFFIHKRVCIHPVTSKQSIILHYTHKGKVFCELMSFGKVTLHEGTYHLFCVPKGVNHNAYFEKGYFCSIHIDINEEQLLNLNLSEQGKNSLMCYLNNPDAVGLKLYEGQARPVVKLAIKRVQQCKINNIILFKEFLKATMQQLIYYFAEDLASNRYDLNKDSGQLQEIAAYLESKLEINITLSELAREFHTNASTLKKQWKQWKGITIRKYIEQRRMEAAKNLLLETTLKLADIAKAIGYANHCSFTRIFKKHTGISPFEFRKRGYNKK